MRNMNEREYSEDLVLHADDTVNFLSNERKQERERSVCAALLRCLGIEFSPTEIISSNVEPPDVIFREGRFEVMIILDEGRKMHQEWKAKYEKFSNAKPSDDLSEPATTLASMSYEIIIDLVTKSLNKKAQHYNQKGSANLDALVYMNLKGKYLDKESPPPEITQLRSQGWRSVSILFHSCALVLYAKPSAPPFLRKVVGRTMAEWNSPFGLFDL